MSITNKVTVGLVSLAFIFSFVTVSFVATAADSDDISVLQTQIAKLLEQIKDLQSTQNSGSSSTGSVSVATGSNAACTHTWTRNLSIGSTGDDVRQLQRFLNGNPQTQVAVSGAGSPGNESSYYGPATARAVSKFQEMYAAQILTPLDLTEGTGGFYTSTRAHLNEVCQRGTGSNVSVNRSGTRSATTPAVVRVTGDALAVTSGNPISDSYVVFGAQRAPFTSVVLTAGTDDVRIESIRIKRFGLSSSDNFESIALVDANGVQVGSARSLNSRDEVSLGSNFTVPANRSVTLAVIGNMTSDSDEFSSGSIAGLEIAEVIADTRVQGTFPIRGAAHVLSDSIDLQKVVIEVSGGGGSIEFNEDTEVASVTIDLSTDTVDGEDADKEDAYLRSVILEQVGSADERELGDLDVFVDDDSVDYTIAVDRDRFIINFGGKGVLIEEGDDVEITIETTTDRGYEETVQFAIDDVSDVYILGASYGYGLPVCFEGDDGTGSDGVACDGKENGTESWLTDENDKTAEATISSGNVSAGDRLKRFEDEVRYGDDVILGALSVEFEGEDILMEDLVFKVELRNYPWVSATDNAWVDADEDTVRFDSVRLRVDGENIAYADDSVDFDEPDVDDGYDYVSVDDDERLTVDFDSNFVLDVEEDREIIFEIVADLDEAWSYFEGATVEFILIDVDTAEGVNSEKKYNENGEYFSSALDFKDVKIKGNELTFEINDDGMDGTSFVRGADSVVFGTVEVDAKDAIDDVELRDLYVSFQIPADTTGPDTEPVGDLSDLNNCRILDSGGDEIADSRGVTGEKDSDGDYTDLAVSDQARFRFDGYVIASGEREDLDIVCDIDDGAAAGDGYRIVVDTGSAVRDRVKYRIGRDESEFELESDSSSLLTVDSSGVLEVATTNPDEDETLIAVATGNDGGVNNVAVLAIELEAEKEDIEIIDVYLVLPATFGAGSIAMSDTELEKVYDRFTLEFGNTTADADDYIASKTFASGDYDNQSADVTGARIIEFDDVLEVVQDGEDETETFDLTVDFNGIDENDGSAGQFIEGTKLIIVWEGDDSGTTNLTEHSITSGDFTTALPFPTVPTVSTEASSPTLKIGKQKIYEFTVNADDEGDVYLDQVGFTIGLSGSALVSDLNIYRGTDNSGTIRASKSGSIAVANHKVSFTNVEEIDGGESRTYSVYANVTAAPDGSAVTVEMIHDGKEATPALGRENAATRTAGNFVWSPNAKDGDGAKSSNADWFTGWAVVTDSDTKQWSLQDD